MRLAIQAGEVGVAEGMAPFAACIVKDAKIVCCMHNHVWQDGDITAHAEIVAIREACRKLGTVNLSGCSIYSTCEPCPMCFGACHWARISKLFYGSSIEEAGSLGFNELTLTNRWMKEQGHSPIEIHSGLLKEECAELFRDWAKRPDKKTY